MVAPPLHQGTHWTSCEGRHINWITLTHEISALKKREGGFLLGFHGVVSEKLTSAQRLSAASTDIDRQGNRDGLR